MRNGAARSFRQLRRFHHVINSDKVFGTHKAYSVVCVLPKMTAPAARKMATMSAFMIAGLHCSRLRLPARVRCPAISMTSLTATGMP